MTDGQFRQKLGDQLDELMTGQAESALMRIAIAVRQNYADPTDQADAVIEILGDYGIPTVEDLEEAEYEEIE